MRNQDFGYLAGPLLLWGVGATVVFNATASEKTKATGFMAVHGEPGRKCLEEGYYRTSPMALPFMRMNRAIAACERAFN